MKWTYQSDHQPTTVEELKQILIQNRHIDQPDLFFNPAHPASLSLEELSIDQSGVDQAVRLILEAQETDQEIVVFGDYDADGISAASLVWRILHELGAKVAPFIPDREKHGYGISDAAIDDLETGGLPALVMTVDNGIVAHQPIARLQKAGTKVIVTDHHTPESTPVPADAIVHTTKLCGATVGWILMRELLHVVVEKGMRDQPWANRLLEEQLDLAAIATISDQVPLQDANRCFAFHGLKALQKSNRVGLQALYEQARVDPKLITPQTVGFVIAPRINAMGRMKHGLEAMRLLCTQDQASATKLAAHLGRTNTDRQEVTSEMVDDALAQADAWQDEHLIVVSSTKYHEGVVGLLAGRLMEKYWKPAIVVSVKEEIAKASARSIPGVNIIELIREVKADLLSVGGHPMAAGFSVEPAKLDQVATKLRQLALAQINPDHLNPKLTIDCQLPYRLTTTDITDLLASFEPFGTGNPQPIFAWHDLVVLSTQIIGKKQNHLKLTVSDKPDGQPLTCLWWRQSQRAAELTPGTRINLAGALDLNEWRGRVSVQVRLRDVIFHH